MMEKSRKELVEERDAVRHLIPKEFGEKMVSCADIYFQLCYVYFIVVYCKEEFFSCFKCCWKENSNFQISVSINFLLFVFILQRKCVCVLI